MASETESASSFLENLMNSRNRELSMFLPFILAVTNSSIAESADLDEETQESTTPSEYPDRIILVNPLTQGMIVMENRSSTNLESFMSDLLSKEGQPPASKASIEALPSLEICEGEKGECVICLEEWESGGVVKEMPCKHSFHGECIEKWLKIHGSCPVCRHKMPEETDLNNKSENRGRRREIWMNFSVGNDRRSAENNQTTSANSNSVPQLGYEHNHAPES